MKNNPQSQSGVFAPRVISAFLLCSAGVFLAMLGFAAAPPNRTTALAVKPPNELSAVKAGVSQFKGNDTTTARMALAPTTPSGWSIVNSPNINVVNTDQNTISAVTCASESDCWAVGFHGARDYALIEHWDGNSWTIAAAPVGDGGSLDPFSSVLGGVACTSASSCWAVGYYHNYDAGDLPLIERWDGNKWSIVTLPITAGYRYLSAVTCAAESDCWAVGYYYLNNHVSGFIEHWDGNSWAIVTSPDTYFGRLSAVTCASQTDCWAVGSYYVGNQVPLIEHWDGNAWAIVPAANPGSLPSLLNGVDCVSSSECWAVGNYHDENANHYYDTLIEHWNGSAWSIVTTASTAGDLRSVTCTMASNCWAVGSVIEHWDGTSWLNVATPTAGELAAVTCNSASDCWGIGGLYRTLTEHWDGTTWNVVPSPNYGDTQNNELVSVSCASASECWAAGSVFGKNLLQKWDGTSWSIGAPVSTGYQADALTGITCVSSSECWTTGTGVNYNSNPNVPGPYYYFFFERWDGNSWNLAISTSGSRLNSVTCASASDCWAVGNFIERWNGSAWSFQTYPPSGTLYGVTCASAAECWAVGSIGIYVGDYVPLLEHTRIAQWNGSEWIAVSSPNTDNTHTNRLNSVACGSATECWAVGYYVDDSDRHQTLIEKWNGTSWVIFPSPNNGTQNNQLLGVTCPLATDCRAVGYYTNSNGISQTLVEQWNGSSWEIVPSANTDGTHHNRLNSVTCLSASDCWAVGIYNDDTGVAQTLIEHWTPPVQLVSAVSRKVHGSAGAFDIDLPLTSKPGIECRSGGASGKYQVIATFAAPVTMTGASVVYGSGSASSAAAGGSQVKINLAGVTNGQTTIVRLVGVNDGTNSASVDIPMGVLFGDTTANG